MKHILLVDDDEDDWDFFRLVLNAIDPSFTCTTASNGLLALQQLATGNLPDFIFLDLNMPIMNGKQFLIRAKEQEQLKDIPIVILSTSSDRATIAEVTRLGAAGFITKPSKLLQLETSVREILGI